MCNKSKAIKSNNNAKKTFNKVIAFIYHDIVNDFEDFDNKKKCNTHKWCQYQ